MNNYIYGIHAITSSLENSPDAITTLYVSSTRHDDKLAKIIALAEKQHITIEYVNKTILENLVGNVTHQSVVAAIENKKSYTEEDLEDILDKLTSPALLLILDGVQDPHNLGACLRSANAAGVHAVIAPKDRAASLTPTARKIACGAAETTPFIQVTNLARTLRSLKQQNIWLYGMAEGADKSLFAADFKFPTALVLGAEGTGVRRLTKDHCDELLNIPMAGTVSSLNVSVAAGICLFEVVRQRLFI